MRESKSLLIGEKYFKLKIIKEDKKVSGTLYYLCECECGTKKVIKATNILSGNTKSCGCLIKIINKNRIENLLGKRFERLVVIEKSENHPSDGRVMWLCQCDCGNTAKVKSKDLKRGKTKSCGCLSLELKRLDKGQAAFNNLYKSYKSKAKKRNMIFELSEHEFKKLTQMNCYYCEKKPLQSTGKRTYGEYIYNGIDRLDNFIGYTLNNCVPCCGRCNQTKSNKSIDEFLLWIKTVYLNLQQKGIIK